MNDNIDFKVLYLRTIVAWMDGLMEGSMDEWMDGWINMF